MASSSDSVWNDYWRRIESARSTVGRTKSVNVNKDSIRSELRNLVQEYFRTLRPGLVALGVNDDALAGLDKPAQELLRLATGQNSRSSYVRTLRALHNARVLVETERELRMGHAAAAPKVDIGVSGVERRS